MLNYLLSAVLLLLSKHVFTCDFLLFFFKPSPLLGKLKCGENLFMSSHPFPWTRVIQSWYDENKNFKHGVGANPPNAVIGHYTQVVLFF